MKAKRKERAERNKKEKWTSRRHSEDSEPRNGRIEPDEPWTKTVLTGHSFIRRLQDEMWDRSRRGLSWPEVLHVRVTPLVKGWSGLKLNEYWRLESYIKGNQPTTVLIEMGSNDLCDDVEVDELADYTINLLKNTLQKFSCIHNIIWCEVTPRGDLPRQYKWAEDYNEDVANFNELMIQKLLGVDGIHHWKHHGLTHPDRRLMSDGIHPDTTEGMRLYINSISRACRQSKVYGRQIN